jgi:hypothetical protein
MTTATTLTMKSELSVQRSGPHQSPSTSVNDSIPFGTTAHASANQHHASSHFVRSDLRLSVPLL